MEKIIILGNTWHGNWSTALKEELLVLGYDAKHINVRYEKKSGLALIERFRRKAFFVKLNFFLSWTLRRAKKVIVITPYSLPHWFLQRAKQKNISLIGWWGDDPLKKRGAAERMKYFDKIYLVDESWIVPAASYNSNIFYLPHAFSPKKFFPLQQQTKTHSVTFVGDSFNGEANGVKRAEMLEVLHNAGIKLSLFGDKGWRKLYVKFPFLKEIYQRPIHTPTDLNTLYNDSQVVLNLHHEQLIWGTNQRTFEAAGSGAFQISDYKPAIKAIFRDEIPLFSSKEELLEKVTYYLGHAREREVLADRSRETAVASHTYKDRILRLLKN